MTRTKLFRWKRMTVRSKSVRSKRLSFETLEPRRVLDGGPLITEFMAGNSDTLLDGDGDSSDWIEIHNPTDAEVDLALWYLTDDMGNLDKWQFPSDPAVDTLLASGEYLVVFASGKDVEDYVDPLGYLHTTFKLGSDGESVALVESDGQTVASAYADYPEQLTDVSYGYNGSSVAWESLVSSGAAARYHVPTAGEGSDWTARSYDDSSWTDSVVLPPAEVVVTEVNTGQTDWVEIQNVSDQAVDTSGWFVAANDASAGDINDVHSAVWDLSASMAAGQVLYKTDNASDNYFGTDIAWDAGSGWVMIVDDGGSVVDFLVWGYSESEIGTLDIDVNGFTNIAVGDQWRGETPTGDGANGEQTQLDLIDIDEVWSYDQSRTDLGTAWRQPGYVDSGWSSGAALLYAESGALPATKNTPLSLGATTYYFRTHFSLDIDPSLVTQLDFSAVIDDGAVFYLNGVEVEPRLRMPTGDIGYGTYASGSVYNATYEGPFSIPTDNLVAGDNVIAVEVHQATLNSSDVVFGLQLDATATFPTFHRTGNSDSNSATDFSSPVSSSKGTQNSGLTVPFDTSGIPVVTGLGFSDDPEFAAHIQTGVGDAMQGVNTSLWTRIEFQVDDTAEFDLLTLRMKYDDGMAAYINGVLVAERNVPDTLEYDSAAELDQPNSQAIAFEEIDITDSLTALSVGTNVLAIHGLDYDGGVDNDFLMVPELIARSVLDDPQYMVSPTPGGANIPGALGVVEDTEFSVDRGIYADAFDLEITSETPEAEIRYTLDGTEPSATYGTPYDSPVTINSTTTLRAIAYKPGYIPTNVDTQTYLFIADVIAQSTSPGGDWPTSSVNGQVMDYGMDPDVTVNDTRYADLIDDALLALPSISLVTDLDNLFDSTTGIYVNAQNDGRDWERETSMELINPDGSEGFQIDAGLRIRGGSSRASSNPKHSFRVFFRSEYGDAKLEFPLFGDEGADTFDKIDLRTGQNFSWNSGTGYRGEYATWLYDTFTRDSSRDMDQPYTRGDFFHLYLNGQYWGLYQTEERPEANYGESYMGGDDADYDALKSGDDWGQIAATDGTLDGYYDLWTEVNSGTSNNADYFRIQGMNSDGTPNSDYTRLLDVDNLIDYMILVYYTGNRDMPLGPPGGDRQPRNLFMIYNREDPDGVQFIPHDAEHSLEIAEGVYFDRVNVTLQSSLSQQVNSTPWWLHLELIADNAEYRTRFADRVHDYFFNDGLLTPDAAEARLMARAAEIDLAVIAESARWGDAQSFVPRTKDDDWLPAVNLIVDNFFQASPNTRTDVVLSQFEGKSWYPSLVAPSFNQHGGQVAAGFEFTISAPSGVIYYTLDGTDPREIGGSISGDASAFNGTPITFSESSPVLARTYSGGQWSALNQATFYVSPPAADELVITELNFNPYGPTADELATQPVGDVDFTAGDFEFVELRNDSDQTVDLIGVHFSDGIEFEFGPGDVTTLDAGQYVVLASNIAAFEARYGTGVNVAGQYSLGLGSNGEQITLLDPFDQTLVTFQYDDSAEWPGRADGKGATLVPIDTAGDYNDPANWDSSVAYGGTPGADSQAELGIVVNEVLTHTDNPQVDTIELHNTNTSGDPIDLGGWYLSDSWGWDSEPDNGDYQKFRIPDGTTIAPGEYVVFYEGHYDGNDLEFDQLNEFGGTGANNFALDGARGDDVWLMKADASGNLTHFGDHVEFGAAANGESFGRWPNGSGDPYPMVSNTFGVENIGPRIGPVLISEVMYNPPDPDGVDGIDPDDLEFIEIYNPGPSSVDLWESYFVDDVWQDYPWQVEEFEFAAGTTLAAGEALVVLRFDPADTTRLDTFKNHYGLVGTSVQIVGGYSGTLLAGGETVRLEWPDEPAVDDAGLVVPYILEDEVDYANTNPWPTEPDGGGLSLTRSLPAAWGHTATSWTAADPTPGEVAGGVVPTSFSVTAIVPTPSGFVASFSRPLDPADLSLYDVAAGTLGQADVSLVGSASGIVEGSLVVGTNSVTFVAVDGPLTEDDYTVTLRSATNGFRDLASGELLDGNGDGTPGDDFSGEFTVGAVRPVIVSLPDFVRGADQPVNVPATQDGLPLRLSDATGVESVSLTIQFDPELLNVTGALLGADAPDGSTVDLNTATPGMVTLGFTSGAPLTAGGAEFVLLTADVPLSAAYGDSHVLQIGDVIINQGAINATADHAIHVAAFLGDATGNGGYSGLDAQRVARVAVGLDSGFETFPTIHPVVLADITGNGAMSGLDAQRIAQKSVGLDVSEIPQIPQQPLRLSAPGNRNREISGSQFPNTPNSHESGYQVGPNPCESGYGELAYEQLSPIIEAAVVRIASGERDQAEVLEGLSFEIVDLPGDLLGMASGQTIQIDINAAGYGWFVDTTPWDDVEFHNPHSAFRVPHSVDLLTTVLHELGHVLGFEHEDHGVMEETLPLGTRRLWADELPPSLSDNVIDNYFAMLK